MDARVLVLQAQAFFQWCDENPRYRTEIIKHKLSWDTVDIELKRPYTLSGLCMHLGVSQGYLRQTKADLVERLEAGRITEAQLQVLAAIEWVYQIVFTDQIEGAASGQYNANIVARLNGLADNVHTSTMPDPVLRITVRDAETATNLNLLTEGL
jgi:hypothetical protein